MKKSELKSGYYAFGSKGAVWSDAVHIAGSAGSTTLCGTPMLSRNHANLMEHPTVKCSKCLEKYNELNQ